MTAKSSSDAVITIGESRNRSETKKFMRLIERSRTFFNDTEVFLLSRRKARKLAYRWKGAKRGERIAAWLARGENTGVIIEAPQTTFIGVHQ